MVKGIISLDSLINIICEAGDKILPMRNNSNSFQISKKNDKSLLTNADLLAKLMNSQNATTCNKM